MKKKINIAVVTGSRADYGLLYWTMKKLQSDKNFNLKIFVTGMHLSFEYGLTYKIIENDGFEICEKIETVLSSDTPSSISKSIGLGIIGFADAFNRHKIDMLLILGDRYEIFAAVIAAHINQIKIAHCHGGELTEGLIDDGIRHSITKFSNLHLVSTDIYGKRVIQLGENPKFVVNVGALGIENIYRLKLLSKYELEKKLNFKFAKNNILVTYHPVTLEKNKTEEKIKMLLDIASGFKDINFYFTFSNSDTFGRVINNKIIEATIKHKNIFSFVNLGQLNYLSLMKNVDCVLGNSSSGIIEAPSFNIYTINIGDRQRGRVRAKSVIDKKENKKEIKEAIEYIFSKNKHTKKKFPKSPYDSGYSSDKIVSSLKVNFNLIKLKKTFKDLMR